MSKAMDALELVWRIMCDGGDTDIEACAAACALLRDYITTTEAVGEVPDDVGALLDKLRGIWKTDEDGDGALLIAFIAKRETAWAIALAGEQLAHETDLTQSAARIKELEEALKVYITTTEAEKRQGWAGEPIELRAACRKRLPLGGADAQALEHALKMTEDERDESAARIKELEEALKRIDVRKDDDAWWIHVDGKPHAGILRLSEKPSMCADAFIEWEAIRKAALSGARKVNSLGSVRGDEHLGAMLPDDGARKVGA